MQSTGQKERENINLAVDDIDLRPQGLTGFENLGFSGLVKRFNSLNSSAKVLLSDTGSKTIPFIPMSDLSDTKKWSSNIKT